MFFEYLALYINTAAYLLPPFRQYGGRYFLFFLVLALGNPFAIFIIYTTHLNPKRAICIISWAAFTAIVKKFFTGSRNAYIVILSLAVISLAVSAKTGAVQIVSIIINLLILFYFIKELARYFSHNYSIHIGYIVLILYEIGLISKFYLDISNRQYGLIYFYFTDLFEMLIAIFFTIYKTEKAPVIRLKHNIRNL